MNNQIYANQRVGVFVDVQNMYYSAKNLYNAKVNFNEILRNCLQGRTLIRALAYVIKADVKDEVHFRDALKDIGFEVMSKELQVFYGGHKKGDWDVGIAMDVMKLASKLDVVVLVSGDGDFRELLEHVQALGCKAEVMAFGRTASSRIKDVADIFIDMDKNKKYLIPLKPGMSKNTMKSQNNHQRNTYDKNAKGSDQQRQPSNMTNVNTKHENKGNNVNTNSNGGSGRLPISAQPFPKKIEKKEETKPDVKDEKKEAVVQKKEETKEKKSSTSEKKEETKEKKGRFKKMISAIRKKKE